MSIVDRFLATKVGRTTSPIRKLAINFRSTPGHAFSATYQITDMDFDYSKALEEKLLMILEKLNYINPRMMQTPLERLEAQVASDPLHQQALSLIQQELAVSHQSLTPS